eukprot:jgi/Mesvir1/20082/Mv13331-RA.1
MRKPYQVAALKQHMGETSHLRNVATWEQEKKKPKQTTLKAFFAKAGPSQGSATASSSLAAHAIPRASPSSAPRSAPTFHCVGAFSKSAWTGDYKAYQVRLATFSKHGSRDLRATFKVDNVSKTQFCYAGVDEANGLKGCLGSVTKQHEACASCLEFQKDKRVQKRFLKMDAIHAVEVLLEEPALSKEQVDQLLNFTSVDLDAIHPIYVLLFES